MANIEKIWLQDLHKNEALLCFLWDNGRCIKNHLKSLDHYTLKEALLDTVMDILIIDWEKENNYGNRYG